MGEEFKFGWDKDKRVYRQKVLVMDKIKDFKNLTKIKNYFSSYQWWNYV